MASSGPGGGPGGALTLGDWPALRTGPELLVGLSPCATHMESQTRVQHRDCSRQDSAFSLHLS